MFYIKQKENINIYYLAYGYREINNLYGDWTFLGLRLFISDINEVVEANSDFYDEIRILKFDADVYGTEML